MERYAYDERDAEPAEDVPLARSSTRLSSFRTHVLHPPRTNPLVPVFEGDELVVGCDVRCVVLMTGGTPQMLEALEVVKPEHYTVVDGMYVFKQPVHVRWTNKKEDVVQVARLNTFWRQPRGTAARRPRR